MKPVYAPPVRARLTAVIVMAAAATTATAGPSSRATMTIGDTQVAGGLTADQVGAPIATAKRALRACHHRRAGARRALHGGEVAAAFTITAAGTVEDPAASGVDPDVATCVTGVLAGLAFPAADAPTTVAVAVRYRVPLDKTIARVTALARTAVAIDPPEVDLAQLDAMIRDQQDPSGDRLRPHGDPGAGLRGSANDAMALGTIAIRIADPAPPLELVVGIVAAHRTALDACFAPTALDTTFTVDADATGAVTRVALEPRADAATTTCATAVVGALRLPATADATRFELVYARTSDPPIAARETFHFEH